MDTNEEGELSATRFGNFEVLQNDEGGLYLLGGGGFGKTYKARHVYLNQVVALKVINDRFLHDNSAKERFLREAQVVNQLRHPHIAHVVDFGEVKSALYYAMEFCGGGNLENMVHRLGPLPLSIVVRCARQLAEALGCAHSHGFIHRDVKPANIMLTGTDDDDPQLKLVDFGLVKSLQGGAAGEATAALTMTGQQFFTIQFASPEQLMEEELDARSDLFALGMTLWFLIKGAPPETGSMASIVAKRLDSRSYEALLPGSLPPAYRALLGRLLEKDRGQRFQNTDELLAALDAAEANPNVAATDATLLMPQPEAEAEPEPEPEPADAGPVSITAHYDVQENLGSMPLGVLYRATRKKDSEQVAITMVSDVLREDPAQLKTIQDNVARLQSDAHESIARLYGLEDYQEGLALVQEWHQGVSLHTILKTARFLSYADALRVLQPIAQGTDWTTEEGLPGIVLAMDEIYLQPLDAAAHPDPDALLQTPLKNWPPFRVRLLPYVIKEDTAQDVGMTLNTEIVSDPTVAFSCLLYHLVAGHAPRAAAKLTKGAYVTIGRLAEDTNRLLASCIVNERDIGGCEGVLRLLNGSEGVNFPTDAGRGGGVTEAKVESPKTSTGGKTGGPIDLTKGRTQTGGGLKTDSTGLRTTGGGGTQTPEPKTDTQSRNVIQTKTLTRTGGLGGNTGGTTTGRSAGNLAKQVEEARQRKEAEEAQRRQQQVEEARQRSEAAEALRQQQAEETRLRNEAAEVLRKQQVEEARQRKEAEDAVRKQQAEEARQRKEADDAVRRQQAEDARLIKQAEAEEARQRKLAEDAARKQQAEEARLKKQAEDAVRKQQAEEARQQKQAEDAARKQQADEARQQKLAEEALRKQQLADERAARGLPPVPPSGGISPLVWVAGALVMLVLALGIVFLALRGRSGPSPDPTPAPTPVVVTTPTPAPTVAPTAAPVLPSVPTQFVFEQGFSPDKAMVKLNFTALDTMRQGSRVIVPLSGAKLGDKLTVEAPGWETRSFPISANGVEKTRVDLRRQQGKVRLTASTATDYTTAVFKALRGLDGEQSYVQMSADDRAVALSATGGEVSLPTGIYLVTLQGSGGLADARVKPTVLEKSLAVTAQGTTLALPAGFGGFPGKYTFEFMFKPGPNDDPIQVRRTFVIDPGMTTGHVDDFYPNVAAKLANVTNTPITDISTDPRGVLHGIIRFSTRTDNNFGYDEQFELSYANGGYQIVGGGWEMQPTDAATVEKLQQRLQGYTPHLRRPDPQAVTKK